MKLPLIALGLWMRLVAIPLLIPLGLLQVTHLALCGLYRTSWVNRPLTATLAIHAATVLFVLMLPAGLYMILKP